MYRRPGEGFKLDFIAEGYVGTLDVNGFFLIIYFDGHGEKKLQTTIPDIIWVQHKPFDPWWASEDKVYPIISIVRPVWKRPIVYRMLDLQCPENADVSLTQHRSANLDNGN